MKIPVGLVLLFFPILFFTFVGAWLVSSENRIIKEIKEPRTVYISVDDPNLALLIADKDATILHWRKMNDTLEKRYYRLAKELQECGEN